MSYHYPMAWKCLSRPALVGLMEKADGVYGSILPVWALPRSGADLQPL